MQKYLKSGNGLSSYESQNIFMMKMRNMVLMHNFPSMFSDKKCIFRENDDSHKDDDSQIHLCQCLLFPLHECTADSCLSHPINFTAKCEIEKGRNRKEEKACER